jgi:hypothetical protein
MEPRFDGSKEFDVPIRSGGIKRCVVRFPTDEEWITFESENKSLRRFLGNDKSVFEETNKERACSRLLDKIRVDKDGAEFDEAMAVLVVDRLKRADVVEVCYEGDQFTVKLEIMDGPTEHVVRDPEAKHLLAYRRTTARTVNNISGRSAETHLNLRAAKEFYDQIHVSHEGYVGAVPIIHMEAVAQAINNQLALFEERVGRPER